MTKGWLLLLLLKECVKISVFVMECALWPALYRRSGLFILTLKFMRENRQRLCVASITVMANV